MNPTVFKFRTILKNRLFYALSVILLITTSCSDEFDRGEINNSQLEIETRSTTELCLTTMNTFLLDSPVGPQCDGLECEQRARMICNLISLSFDSDVVMLQEVWVEEAGEALIACMEGNGYVFHTGFNGGLNFNPIWGDGGSGLITFSKHPITYEYFEAFNISSGLLNCSNDDPAGKGFLHTRINIGDCEYDFINTHLDAGECDGDYDARNQQLTYIRAYIYKNLKGKGFIIGGDMNVIYDSDEYPSMNNILGTQSTFDGLGIEPGATTSDGNAVLDYILYGGSDGIRPTSYTEGFGSKVTCYFTFTQEYFDQLTEDEIYDIYVVLYGVPDVGGPNDELNITTPKGLANFQNLNDFPKSYWPYVEETCTYTNLDANNPSDHLPVTSCFELDCDEETTGGDDNPPNEDGCVPKCIDGDCINGICNPH